MTKAVVLSDYPVFLADLKERILQARTSAARAVNREMILLYWDIGRGIVEKQQLLGWGDGVIDKLSSDLRSAFPDHTGFFARNLRDMKRFYIAYSDQAIWRQAVAKLEKSETTVEFLPQLVAEIPWGHHRFILDKLSDPMARIYYLCATAQFGWFRNVLLNLIKAKAFERAVKEKKTHNFDLVLPEHFAEPVGVELNPNAQP